MFEQQIGLFQGKFLEEHFRYLEHAVSRITDRIPQDQFMNSSDTELLEYIFSQVTVTPLKIYQEKAIMKQAEAKISVPSHLNRQMFRGGAEEVAGTELIVSYPYSGDFDLWTMQPSMGKTGPLGAVVGQPDRATKIGTIKIIIKKPHTAAPESFQTELNKKLELIQFFIDRQSHDIVMFNKRLPQWINEKIANRRDRIQRHQGLSAMLKIHLEKSPGSPSFDPIKLEKKITVDLPPAPRAGFSPEPGISESDYEIILKILRHGGRSYEKAPQTFGVHDEEGLRDILLAHLNTHFQGVASAETFRRKGKTDICIEDSDRVAFVAECKVWTGEGIVIPALEQLLGYLTWRDCKAALIIFNKSVAGFTQILKKLEATLMAHPNKISHDFCKETGEWRFTFKCLEDEERRITVHVFAFNIFYQPPERSPKAALVKKKSKK